MGGVPMDIAHTLEQAGSGPITLRARPNCIIIHDESGAWYSVAERGRNQGEGTMAARISFDSGSVAIRVRPPVE
eukprot:5497594-Alexandrium_andersonii.AAC.1